MCNQTVGLIQAAIECEGIATVSISLLREVASAIKPPRALFVPFAMGFPLGEPNNAALQHQVIAAALRLLERNDLPVLEIFRISTASGSERGGHTNPTSGSVLAAARGTDPSLKENE